MPLTNTILSSLVIGGCGAVGSLFAQKLRETLPELKISVLDFAEPKIEIQDIRYENDLKKFADSFNEFDLIILALPEAAALSTFREIRSWVKSDALVVDTLSVKSNIYSEVKSVPVSFQYLSINPMFAPSIGFSDQTVLAVPIQSGDRTIDFLALLSDWGAAIKKMTVNEHDTATAQLQSLTHLAIMAFGFTLVKSGYNINQLLSIAPPPHKVMLSLIARILSGSPEVYRDIQYSNPYAAEIREKLVDSINEIGTLTTQGNPSDYVELFDSFNALLLDQQTSLAEQCKKLFNCLS